MNKHGVLTTSPWRFIPYEEKPAAYNMAVDEAILNAHLNGTVAPTLRIYGFSPPALSIGSSQRLTPEIVDRAQSAGLEMVRRPTGGRAVLHLGDLTYCFVGCSTLDKSKINAEQFLLPTIVGAYRQICQGLILAFKELGLTLELGGEYVNRHPDCFATTTAGDLHINGLKVVGSAQLRRKAGVLQHGTIILRQDPSIMQRIFAKNDGTPQAVRHANLYDLLGRDIPMRELQSAIVQGFQEAFHTVFQAGSLSAKELREVDVKVNQATRSEA
jgi:lipoate-protein ligase A